ncbi:MAG TPA: MarR family transcriptional regulator [Methylophilus sp.]
MEHYDNLKLDHQLCFALYSATHAFTRAYRNDLDKFGLTYSQYLIMLVLWENDACTVSDIAKRLQLDVGSITPVLKRLETTGFVARNRSKNDERVVIINLTEAGHHLKHDVAPVQQCVEAQTGLSKQDFTVLKKALHQLTSHMNAGQTDLKDDSPASN